MTATPILLTNELCCVTFRNVDPRSLGVFSYFPSTNVQAGTQVDINELVDCRQGYSIGQLGSNGRREPQGCTVVDVEVAP